MKQKAFVFRFGYGNFTMHFSCELTVRQTKTTAPLKAFWYQQLWKKTVECIKYLYSIDRNMLLTLDSGVACQPFVEKKHQKRNFPTEIRTPSIFLSCDITHTPKYTGLLNSLSIQPNRFQRNTKIVHEFYQIDE